MVRFEKVELTISSKLEVPEVDSDGPRPRSWLVTVSVMACGGLLPYDIRKAIDTKTFCLACTDPGFKWIPLDFADKSILMFRIFELEKEEDNCKMEFVADTMPTVMERSVSMSQDFSGKPKTATSKLLRIRDRGMKTTLSELQMKTTLKELQRYQFQNRGA